MIKIIFLFLFSISCTTQYDCDDLSMKKYKGIPAAAQKFDTYCTNKKIQYSAEVCQKALVDLTIFQNQRKLIAKYGPRIMECFTSRDLERFLK